MVDVEDQTALMAIQPHKGYFIEGTALLIHPYSPDWHVGGSVLKPGRLSSIIEVARFELRLR
jgi:hypothetical protein